MSISSQLRKEFVPLNNILLDPNNPRFFELENWERVEDNMFHLDRVQSTALQRLEGTDIGQIETLIASIKSNGFIAAEMIVVKPYDTDNSKYVLIEGNRRLTALKSIIRNSLDPERDVLVQSLQTIEVLVYQPTGDLVQDQMNEMILQGIRHISGPKEWGAYQKANLIIQLYDSQGLLFPEIAQRLAMGPRMTVRLYRAFKALRQMMADPEFGDYAHPRHFSLIDEAVNKTAIKEWLGWDDKRMDFTNASHRSIFYGLLIGDPESDENRKPSISNPQHMRKFADLLISPKQTVLHRFLEGEISIDDAYRLAEPEPLGIPLRESIQSFLEALKGFPLDQLPRLDKTYFSLFDEITDKFQFFKKTYASLALPQPEEQVKAQDTHVTEKPILR